jgi:hypothetical protein
MTDCFLAKIGLHYKQSKKNYNVKLKKGPPMLKGKGSTNIENIGGI